MWRSTPQQALPPGFAGVDVVLTGHNPAPSPGWTAHRVLCIDTGVHIEEYGHLSVAETDAGETWHVRTHEVNPSMWSIT